MALHDGLVNWPLFFGSILIAYGPIASIFFTVITKRAQLMILSLTGAFIWMISILVTATFWQILPFMKNSIEITIPVGVVIQEIFRYLFYRIYSHTELMVKKVTTSSHQLPLNDLTSSLAGGVGFSIMHALMMYGSVLASSTGSRGAAFSTSCEAVPVVLASALPALALTIFDIGLMIIAFEGYKKQSIGIIGLVFLLHLAVALSALANLTDNGCYISIPVHYIGALLSTAGAGYVMSITSNKEY